MKETGGDINDYVRLNADYSNIDDEALLKEYYKQTKPHLDPEDVSLLLEDFEYDEDIDEPKDIRKKKIAFKEEAAKAKDFLESLKGKYYDECETALSFASEDVETIEDMLKLLYGTVLEGATDGIEEFKENMDMDKFKENCPLLADFFESASEGMDHEQFYEIVFDMAWKKDVNIIEDDAYITITVDDKEVVKEQKQQPASN